MKMEIIAVIISGLFSLAGIYLSRILKRKEDYIPSGKKQMESKPIIDKAETGIKRRSHFIATILHFVGGTGMFYVNKKIKRKWIYPVLFAIIILFSTIRPTPIVVLFGQQKKYISNEYLRLRKLNDFLIPIFLLGLIDVNISCRKINKYKINQD